MAWLDPKHLFELEPDLPDLSGTVLVEALTGFVDAGGGRRLAVSQLLSTGAQQPVATFDVDLLYDYRARRPAMGFSRDHWESYDTPRLAIDLMHDADQRPYLLLHGPEPDVYWERFITAMQQIIEQLGVEMTVGLNSIPMAVPHTRPVGVIAHGTRPELIAGRQPSWISDVQVPGSVSHLLEFRRGEAGQAALGFAAQVPYYVAEAEYQAGAVALLEAVSAASGLSLGTEALKEAAIATRTKLDEQVAESDEIGTVVHALEEQYDAFVAGQGKSLLADASQLPTAEELGAELERFLRQQSGPTSS